MRPEEVTALGNLAGDAVAGLTSHVREMHYAIARRGRIIGDLLVLRPSAWAHGQRGERLRFPLEHYHHVGGANHFDLLNHPAIYNQICRWPAGHPALAVGAATG